MSESSHTCRFEDGSDYYEMIEISSNRRFSYAGFDTLPTKIELHSLGGKLSCKNRYIYVREGLKNIEKRVRFGLDDTHIKYESLEHQSLSGTLLIDNDVKVGNYSFSLFGSDDRVTSFDAVINSVSENPRCYLTYYEPYKSDGAWKIDFKGGFQIHVDILKSDFEIIRDLFIKEQNPKIDLDIDLGSPNLFAEHSFDSYGRDIKFLRSGSEVENLECMPEDRKPMDRKYVWEEVSLDFNLRFKVIREDASAVKADDDLDSDLQKEVTEDVQLHNEYLLTAFTSAWIEHSKQQTRKFVQSVIAMGSLLIITIVAIQIML